MMVGWMCDEYGWIVDLECVYLVFDVMVVFGVVV